MKKKVLFSIIGIALFAVAIGFGLKDKQEANPESKNIEALEASAGYCPNGCLAEWSPTNCYCNGIVENSKEKDWDEEEDEIR